MYRPRAGIPRVKWLEELKVVTKFVKRNIGKYYKIAAR